MTTPLTLVGFDYGEKRIGVAVGQTLTATATPLMTLAARYGKPDWNKVRAIIEQWCPDALVVGLPLNMDGTEQKATREARRFARRLGEHCPLPIHFADERLSTREARDREHDGVPKQGRDALAAQVILEGWMNGARLEASN
ncbi:MAG: putative Holliday junction resolvase [Gammaproteobacteria bacterium]